MLCGSIADRLRQREKLKGVELRCEMDPTLPRVQANFDLLLQVFDNLVGNALKFTPSGGLICLVVSMVHTQRGTGLGLANRAQHHREARQPAQTRE